MRRENELTPLELTNIMKNAIYAQVRAGSRVENRSLLGAVRSLEIEIEMAVALSIRQNASNHES